MEFKYSVVATTFNDESSIERFLSEIIAQTVKPSEIVIADGGSKDRTVELANSFGLKSNVPVYVLSGKRLNIAEGYNTAIMKAQYTFIGITGLGNRYPIDYFEKMINVIIENNLDGAYSAIKGCDSTTFAQKYNKEFLNGDKGRVYSIASNHGAMMKKTIFEDLGYFYEHFIYAGEDTEFYLRVREKGYKVESVSDTCAYWETPENMKQFLKQTRVYTIADLQMHSKKQINRIRRKLVLMLLFPAFLISSILCIFLLNNITVKYAIATCDIIAMLVILYKILIKQELLIVLRSMLVVYYTFKEKKYMKKEYAVTR